MNVYILAKDGNTEEKFKSKPKMIGLKNGLSLGTVEVKLLGFRVYTQSLYLQRHTSKHPLI